MNDLVNVVQKLGPWAALMVILAYIAIKHILPHWKERDKTEQAFRHEQTRAIMKMQETSLREMTDAIRAGTEADRALASHMEELTDEIRRDRGRG